MLVRIEKPAEHIALLRLADTSKRNALSPSLIESAVATMHDARADGARAIVIAGDDRFFCAGADINGLRDNQWLDVQPSGASPYDLFQAVETHPNIVIAAVEGLALGGGFELALCCDLAVAGSGATFMLPEAGLGVMPNAGIARLAEICGMRRALELILTRRRLSGQEALTWGIVNACVPAGSATAAAVALAQQVVVGAPPAAIGAIKTAMRELNSAKWAAIQAEIAKLNPAEWSEGLGSFLEKRSADYEPFWQGRAAGTT